MDNVTDAIEGVKVEGDLLKLNDMLFFDIIGELGVPCFWNYRASIFHLSYLMTIFSLVASVFCILSVASEENIVMSTNWSFGESDTSRTWVGLSGSFWETIVGSGTVKSYIRWTDAACSDSPESPHCDNCDTGGKAAVFLVLMSCTTRLPSMMLLKARMNPISDIPLIKFLGMVCDGLAAMSLCGAMFIWREYCHVQLPSQSSTTYSYGAGFYMLALGFCMTLLLFVVHVLMPTEDPYDDTSLLDEHLLCCSSKARVAAERKKERENARKTHVEEGSKKKRKRRKKKSLSVSPAEEGVMDRHTDLEQGNKRDISG